MLRNPLQTALKRPARPDLARLADGITASMRSFSVAQRLASDDKSPSSSSSPSAATPRPTNSRSRASAAVDGLISKAEQSVQNLRKAPGSSPVASTTAGGAPNVIRVTSLRGRGRGRGGAFASGPRIPPGPSGVTERPGADYANRPPRTFDNAGRGGGGGRGRGGMTFRGGRGVRGGGRGGRGGRGRGGRRGGGEGAVGERGTGDGQEREGGQKQELRQLDPLFVTEEEAAYVTRLEEGVERPFDPSFTLDSLHGYAPAVATTSSPFGYAATAVASARVLGGGHPYHHEDHVLPHEALARATKGTGVFFPSAESRAWTQEFSDTDAAPQYKAANDETKAAVLEAALQGKYNAPQPVKLGDTLALVENYNKKDTRVYGQPARTIYDKIRSLLPQEAAAAAKAAGGAKASAAAAGKGQAKAPGGKAHKSKA